MTSKEMRSNTLFMRSGFETSGKWEFPTIYKQDLIAGDINLIAYSDTCAHDTAIHRQRGVHFFLDDYRFTGIYNHPEKSFQKLSQYAFLLSPDYSTYSEMDYWRQLESIAHSRWVGAYWQSRGLIVYPTVSWSTPASFDFCFDSIEKGAVVAVGMIGCKHSKRDFMIGYNMMLEKIQPSKIICLGNPYPEMEGELIVIDYIGTRKEAC